jgi:hypothetical protein
MAEKIAIKELTPWAINRDFVQEILAKCYVAMSEVDYDLSNWMWQLAVSQANAKHMWLPKGPDPF